MKIYDANASSSRIEGEYAGERNTSQTQKSNKVDANKPKTSTPEQVWNEVRRANSANKPYGAGDTVTEAGVAVAKFGQLNYKSGSFAAAGESTFLEARARAFTTKTSVGAEAQASLFRAEYGVKYDDAVVKIGKREAFGVAVNAGGEFFVGTQVRAEAGAGMDGIIPYARAGVDAFAGARVGVQAGAGVRVFGVSAGVQGSAQAWAGAQGTAQVSVTPAGIAAEVEGFAGASAEAQGTAQVAGFGVTGQAEANAGIGGEAYFKAGYANGEISVGAGAGYAVGVGAGAGVDVTWNVNTTIKDAERCFHTVAGMIGDATAQTSTAASGAAAAGGSVADEVVEEAEKVVEDTAAAVADAAGSIASTVTGWFS